MRSHHPQPRADRTPRRSVDSRPSAPPRAADAAPETRPTRRPLRSEIPGARQRIIASGRGGAPTPIYSLQHRLAAPEKRRPRPRLRALNCLRSKESCPVGETRISPRFSPRRHGSRTPGDAGRPIRTPISLRLATARTHNEKTVMADGGRPLEPCHPAYLPCRFTWPDRFAGYGGVEPGAGRSPRAGHPLARNGHRPPWGRAP